MLPWLGISYQFLMCVYQIIWMIVLVLSTGSNDNNTFYCASGEETALYHPADMPVWQCESALSSSVGCMLGRGAMDSVRLCRVGRYISNRAFHCRSQATGTMPPLNEQRLLVFLIERGKCNDESWHFVKDVRCIGGGGKCRYWRS